jgi:hypothetical protein
MTPNNAKRIYGTFSKPPRHPGNPVYSPPKLSRPRVVYANNLNISHLTPNEINALINALG